MPRWRGKRALVPITCPACTAIGLIVRGQEWVQSAREAERVARPTSLRFDATRQSSVNRGGGECASRVRVLRAPISRFGSWKSWGRIRWYRNWNCRANAITEPLREGGRLIADVTDAIDCLPFKPIARKRFLRELAEPELPSKGCNLFRFRLNVSRDVFFSLQVDYRNV